MTDEELAKHLRNLGMYSAVVVADRIEQLTAERDRLRLYVGHDDDCTVNRYPATGACSCGLRAAHD